MVCYTIRMEQIINELKVKIRKGYEEAVKSNVPAVSEILYDCIILISKLDVNLARPAAEVSFRKTHKWEDVDAVTAFYLARKYSEKKGSDFQADPITVRLLEVRRTLKPGSLGMAMQNFYSLIKKEEDAGSTRTGLASVSKLGKRVFEAHKNDSLTELEATVRRLIESAQSSAR